MTHCFVEVKNQKWPHEIGFSSLLIILATQRCQSRIRLAFSRYVTPRDDEPSKEPSMGSTT